MESDAVIYGADCGKQLGLGLRTCYACPWLETTPSGSSSCYLCAFGECLVGAGPRVSMWAALDGVHASFASPSGHLHTCKGQKCAPPITTWQSCQGSVPAT
jgi:hypothetical protein